MPAPPTTPTERLLLDFARSPLTERVLEQLDLGAQRRVGGLWGASAALLLTLVQRHWRGPLLVLTADDVESLQLQMDLASFGCPCHVLPRQEIGDDGQPDAQSKSDRQRALLRFAEIRAPLLASLEAMLAPAPSRKALRKGRLDLHAGQPLGRELLLQKGAAAGLRTVPLVLAPGEISVRGDVVDVFPVAAETAVRLEFFDDKLESIRTFDPVSQRTIAVLDHLALPLGETGDSEDGRVVDHLAIGELAVIAYEPLRIDERSAALTAFGGDPPRLIAALHEAIRGRPRLDLQSLPTHDLDYKILSAGSAAGSGEADPVGRLRSIRGVQGRVLLYCRSDDERDRLVEIFAHKQVDLGREQVHLLLGGISRGFRLPDIGATVLSNVEFAGVPQQARVRERVAVPSRAIQSFFELGPGDLVVHAVHGIARFLGTELVHRGEGAEDHLRLCFQDEVILLVPASKIHLVQKYIGAGGQAPLDKLGGKGFQRRKEQVQEALFDLAADLLQVQAERAQLTRPPYPQEPQERDFLDAFPFRDTPDQATAWTEIAADLGKPSPMDRLLCGDVGFGKTELALRAAFRVAVQGRQVAVLVPTTILAEQHARNFKARCEPFGLSVDMLSRYRTTAERKEIHARLLRGQIDILVGTHQILSQDVEFKDLALCIIDEEQRFGVRQKERLKQLRTQVDVLTLSATPIPRTLHASLLGIRGISTLSTPPPGRQEVETRVVQADDVVIQEALLRELGRGGQVFVLHNRIAELPLWAQRIRTLAPGARVAIGHGQMTEAEVEKTVRAFVRGDFDVLVSTTIVENGLDLPRANTILIDHADQFGLAELHQLRGRVGRSEQKAFCLLMLSRDEPPGMEARKRLKALEEFSHLGAGFAIAMKDLEIRGAGNLLGPQQSGHIAAVGYDMYCQLLRAAVQAAKDQRPATTTIVEVDVDLRVQAYLPQDFLPGPRQRLELLREMDEAIDDEHLAALENELRDRYGKLPPQVRALLRVFRLKHGLQGLSVLGVQWVEDDRLIVRHPVGVPLGGSWLDCFADVRPVEAGKTHLMLPPGPRGRTRKGDDVLQFLLEVLSGKAPAKNMAPRWSGSEPRR
ncbi:MAG: transcription-repair coupling factor [Planctomycetes bacterium]|nr:transcription-repair coupling factor [Planctomycetota bacterium]